MIYLTSDTHFCHDKEFIYKPRGFASCEEHNEAIVQRWNEVVHESDTIYHLGDVMLGNLEEGMKCLSRLKGNIKIILGNHDTERRIGRYTELPNVEILGWATIIKVNGFKVFLSHYPTLTGNISDESGTLKDKMLNFFGHTHQHTNFNNEIPVYYHVGVDSHNCYPVEFMEAICYMREKMKECLGLL